MKINQLIKEDKEDIPAYNPDAQQKNSTKFIKSNSVF